MLRMLQLKTEKYLQNINISQKIADLIIKLLILSLFFKYTCIKNYLTINQIFNYESLCFSGSGCPIYWYG